MVIHDLLFVLSGLTTINAQFSMSNHESMGQLTRIPGYHPAIANPGFRTPESRDSGSYARTSSDTCPELNLSCPRDCRRLDDRKCRVCRCHENANIKSDPLVHSQSSAPTRCFPMVMCMLTCKRGYRLSDVTDKHGCQACTCINDQTEGTHSTESLDTLIAALLKGTGRYSSLEAGYGDKTGQSKYTNEKTVPGGNGYLETEHSGMNSFKGHGDETDTAKQEVGFGNAHGSTSSSECSSPMCPGSSGMNPMHPGSGTTDGASSNTNSCTGPFCLGQGGGIGGSGSGTMDGMMAGGGSSGGSDSCNGPFCITGGMMGGSGGGMMGGSGGGMMGGAGGGMMGGAGGGMMGGSGGGMMGGSGGGMMGGAGGGMMGGAGGGMSGSGGMGSGAGGFSPFGMAASGGTSSGCTGPFCTMASAGSATSITSNAG